VPVAAQRINWLKTGGQGGVCALVGAPERRTRACGDQEEEQEARRRLRPCFSIPTYTKSFRAVCRVCWGFNTSRSPQRGYPLNLNGLLPSFLLHFTLVCCIYRILHAVNSARTHPSADELLLGDKIAVQLPFAPYIPWSIHACNSCGVAILFPD
jgi:hypothetical protein